MRRRSSESSRIGARCAGSTTSPRNELNSRQPSSPRPAPTTSRPFESRSNVAASRATTQGRRRASGVTSIPSRILAVAWATAAIVIHESATGMPGTARIWSHRKKPSQPAASADFASSTTRLGSAISANGGTNRPNRSGTVNDSMPGACGCSDRLGCRADLALHKNLQPGLCRRAECPDLSHPRGDTVRGRSS
jgi:hypothetical protein